MKPHYVTDYTTLNGYGLKLMQKQGFKVGAGLGKTETVQEVITVRKKEDTLGIGAKHKVEDKWWERLYDSALQSTPKVDKEENFDSHDKEKNKKHKKSKSKVESESEDEIPTCKRYKQKGKLARIQSAEARLNVTTKDEKKKEKKKSKSKRD